MAKYTPPVNLTASEVIALKPMSRLEPETVPDRDWVHKGTTTLLVGDVGTGKTTSLVTLIEAGLELGVIITDPGGEESLHDAMHRKKLDMSKLHTKYIPPASPSWAGLKDMLTKIGSYDYETLTKIKSGISKQEFNGMLDFLDACANFKADFTNRVLGPVDDWGPDRALAVDGASGLNMMSLALVVGGKPTAHQGEYGVGMNAEEQMIMKLVADTKCFFVLTAHPQREFDEVAQNVKTMAAFLGSKLAPKIPRIFSDVVLSYKEGDKFYWSTSAMNYVLKNRALPLRDKLDPSFVPIVETWKRRREQLEAPTQSQTVNPNLKP